MSLHSCVYLLFKDHPAGLNLMHFCFCLFYPLYCQNFTVKRLKYNIALFLADEHENILSHLTHTHTHTHAHSIRKQIFGIQQWHLQLQWWKAEDSRELSRGKEGTKEKCLKAEMFVWQCRKCTLVLPFMNRKRALWIWISALICIIFFPSAPNNKVNLQFVVQWLNVVIYGENGWSHSREAFNRVLNTDSGVLGGNVLQFS